MRKFKDIDEIIRENVADKVDLVIEGGIGKGYLPRGFYLYKKFRDNGYDGPYFGLDIEESPRKKREIPKRLVYLGRTDCFNNGMVNGIIKSYGSKEPILATDCCESIFLNGIEKITRTLNASIEVPYAFQMHRQTGGFKTQTTSQLKKIADKLDFVVAPVTREVIIVEKASRGI
jgi:hypothetical protein